MGGLSLWHWLVVGVIILLLFGKGRFSDMMGDVAKGLKSFKKGMTDDEEAKAEAERAAPPPPRLDDRTSRPIDVMPERPAAHDHLGDAPIDQPPVRPEERREP